MPNTKLTYKEVMDILFVNPDKSWDEQLKLLAEIENERENGNYNTLSVSHWGIVA